MKKSTYFSKNPQDMNYKKKNKQSYDYNAQDGSAKTTQYGNKYNSLNTSNRFDSRWVYQDDKNPDSENEVNGNIQSSYAQKKTTDFYRKDYQKDYQKKGRVMKFKKPGFQMKIKKKKRPSDDPYPQAKVNKVALEILEEYESAGTSLDKMCQDYYERYKDTLKSKDKPQVQKTVFYVLRWQIRLDYLISSVIGEKEFDQFDLTLRNIYRLAAYNMMFMHRSLEETIMLSHFILPEYYASYRDGMEEFIKGFLEKFKKVSYPDPLNELVRLMSVRYSFPEWITRRWMDRYGEFDSRALLGYHNADKPHVIRINRLKSGVERIKLYLEQVGYNVTKHPLMKYGLFVAGEKKLYTKDPYKNGEFFIMDDPQQIVTEWASPKPDEIMIDGCAGSGEISMAASGLMGNKGKIIAVEFDEALIARFREKMGLNDCSNIQIVSPQDVAGFLSQSEHPLADKVIVDAPNSQLGNIIRKPEAKRHLTEEQLKDFAKDQLTHLGFYAQFVKPGGHLVYSVTSNEPEETDGVIRAFLESNDQFEIVREHEPQYAQIMNPEGCIFIEPHRHNLCGLFACKLRRKN